MSTTAAPRKTKSQFDAPLLAAAQKRYLQAADAGDVHHDDSQVIQANYTR